MSKIPKILDQKILIGYYIMSNQLLETIQINNISLLP